jgi:hypothetical protein
MRLRDIYDVQWLLQSLAETHHALNGNHDTYERIEAVLASAEEMNRMNQISKLVPDQIRFVLRAWQYQLLRSNQSSSSSEEEDEDEAYRKFRLAVKRQLLKDNIELKALEKAEMQKALDEMYGDEETRYKRVLSKFFRNC